MQAVQLLTFRNALTINYFAKSNREKDRLL